MKKWLILATLFLSTSIYAQETVVAQETKEEVKTETINTDALKKQIKKEIVTDVSKELEKNSAAQKKSNEELKFQIKELEAKMKKEIEVSEKMKAQEEKIDDSKLKISGIAFFRSRNEFENTTTKTDTTKTANHYLLGMAQVNLEKQVTPEVKVNLRLGTEGSANTFVIKGDANGMPALPTVQVDHAYMTVDAGLSTNKIGMINQKTSLSKNLYYSVAHKGDAAYTAVDFYTDDLRSCVNGIRTELSFDKTMGLNLTVSKNTDSGKDETVNGVESTKNTKDLYTLDAEFPMTAYGMEFIPEGLIGISDSVNYITAGMNISIPTSVAKFTVMGAGSFDRGTNPMKNGSLGLSVSSPVYKSKDVAFSPSLDYVLNGETYSDFSKQSLFMQHYIDLKLATTYKKFTFRPRWRTFIRPNTDVTYEKGGTFYQKQRFEFDFMVKF